MIAYCLIQRWGESTREFIELISLKVVHSIGWLVNTTQCITSMAQIMARNVCSRPTLHRVLSDEFSKVCSTAAALVPLSCALVANGETVQNGLNVEQISKRAWNMVITAAWLAALYKAHKNTAALRSWCACYTSRNIQDTENTDVFDANVESLTNFCNGRNTMVSRLSGLKLIEFGALPSLQSLESWIAGEQVTEE